MKTTTTAVYKLLAAAFMTLLLSACGGGGGGGGVSIDEQLRPQQVTLVGAVAVDRAMSAAVLSALRLPTNPRI